MSKLSNLAIDEVTTAIKSASNFAQVCKVLECADNSNNRQYLQDIVGKYGIDISHFKKLKTSVTRQQYEENPKRCKHCGQVIPFENRRNDFCDHSCAASFNNTGRLRNTKSKVSKGKVDTFLNISDEEFTKSVKNAKTWKEVLVNLGFSPNAGVDTKNRIRERCAMLKIELGIRKAVPEVNWSTRTKGELFNSSKNWQSARTTIRKMAQKSFEEAEKSHKCIVCGYNKHVEIAHIRAVADFSDGDLLSEINHPDNLVGLCPNHHWEFDNGLISLEELKDCIK